MIGAEEREFKGQVAYFPDLVHVTLMQVRCHYCMFGNLWSYRRPSVALGALIALIIILGKLW
jgi:hypothetical protein